MGLQRQKRVLRAPRVIKVGSDFSGIEAGVTALGRMGIKYKLLFSCDSDPACQKMIQQADNPDVLFNDIKERSPEEEPAVDLYFLDATMPRLLFSREAAWDRGGAGEADVFEHQIHRP